MATQSVFNDPQILLTIQIKYVKNCDSQSQNS